VMVVPEYNGSYPGILKLFIDYWKYPESFEHRPVAFIGLGWRWAGLRPVEHLQGVFGYRNAYSFPVRVFLPNIGNTLKDGKLTDPAIDEMLKTQTREFAKFVRGLKSESLDSVSRKLAAK
jgi:chromate reductase